MSLTYQTNINDNSWYFIRHYEKKDWIDFFNEDEYMGKYYIFDLAGKLIKEENFEPCEHDAQTIKLPPVGGMYILYFDVNEDKRHFPHKVIVW